MNDPLSHAVQKWEMKYSQSDSVFGDDPNDFLQANLKYLTNSKGPILVPGDGDGRNGVWLAKQGLNIVANDGAPSGVKNALSRAAKTDPNLSYRSEVQDLRFWDAGKERYDGIALIHVHFEEPDRKNFYKKLMNALNDQGVLILEVFHPDQVLLGISGPRSVDICVTPEDLMTDFGQLEIVECVRAEKNMIPTEFHKGGLGIVSRLIARKN